MSAPISWRDRIAIHPACAAIPDMGADQFDELAADVRKRNDILQPVVKWRGSDAEPWQLLDGRHRLDALSLLPDGQVKVVAALQRCVHKGPETDPWQYSLSVNVARRHLDADQKRDVIAALLKADPTRSNRAIAALVKDNDHKVASVRAALEATAQISQLTKTVGADGKSRPAHRQPPAAIVHNTTPRSAAPLSKEQQLRELREHPRTPAALVSNTAVPLLLAREIEDFCSGLKGRRTDIERIDRRARLRLARGLLAALGIDPAELGPGGAP
jgi:hypothetical protein